MIRHLLRRRVSYAGPVGRLRAGLFVVCRTRDGSDLSLLYLHGSDMSRPILPPTSSPHPSTTPRTIP